MLQIHLLPQHLSSMASSGMMKNRLFGALQTAFCIFPMHLHAGKPAQLLHHGAGGGRLVLRLRLDLLPQHLQQRAQRHRGAHSQPVSRHLNLQDWQLSCQSPCSTHLQRCTVELEDAVL